MNRYTFICEEYLFQICIKYILLENSSPVHEFPKIIKFIDSKQKSCLLYNINIVIYRYI